jgi:hypothetical protein
MAASKKIGILPLILGVFIPSILYPFATITTGATIMQGLFATKGVLYKLTLQQLKIVFSSGRYITDSKGGHYQGCLAVPYHYAIAIGVAILFAGIATIVLSRRKLGLSEIYMFWQRQAQGCAL